MTRRTLYLTIALIILCLAATCAQAARIKFQHGHLVNLPVYFDSDGFPLWSRTHAFLVVQVGSSSEEGQVVDYTQEVDHADIGGGVTVIGGVINRTTTTASATHDGFLILPLSKPCSPGEAWTYVGKVTVCLRGEVVGRCEPGSVLYEGVPPETVSCVTKRRSIRSGGDS